MAVVILLPVEEIVPQTSAVTVSSARSTTWWGWTETQAPAAESRTFSVPLGL